MFEGLRNQIAEVAQVAPRAYWYVWWGTLINRLGEFVVPLLTIYLITVRHVSVSDAGGIVSVFGAGSLAASLVGGYLSDRLGRKITLVMSLFGGAIALGRDAVTGPAQGGAVRVRLDRGGISGGGRSAEQCGSAAKEHGVLERTALRTATRHGGRGSCAGASAASAWPAVSEDGVR